MIPESTKHYSLNCRPRARCCQIAGGKGLSEFAASWSDGPGAVVARQSDQRSASRMLSDMLGDGALQSRAATAGGTSDSTATTVHPVKDVVPDM